MCENKANGDQTLHLTPTALLIIALLIEMSCSSPEASQQCNFACESNLAACILSCVGDISCQSICNREYTACSTACPCGQNCPRQS